MDGRPIDYLLEEVWASGWEGTIADRMGGIDSRKEGTTLIRS